MNGLVVFVPKVSETFHKGYACINIIIKALSLFSKYARMNHYQSTFCILQNFV